MSLWETQLRKGLAELAILAVLSREEAYGYRIVEKLRTLEGWTLSESTVYPILTRLAREGLLSIRTAASPTGPTRRFYQLTPDGKNQLSKLNQSWRSISGSLETLLAGERS